MVNLVIQSKQENTETIPSTNELPCDGESLVDNPDIPDQDVDFSDGFSDLYKPSESSEESDESDSTAYENQEIAPKNIEPLKKIRRRKAMATLWKR
ncbi:unnamed protein product [Diabrotica balteata]|uniref:Uncharacterized protein n=1 Tax=Diabrotica balteata TaxID=107213 RepID=A0A9N9XIG1_DIABA|nr:unnamed protein product [Diabrotica balteata]